MTHALINPAATRLSGSDRSCFRSSTFSAAA